MATRKKTVPARKPSPAPTVTPPEFLEQGPPVRIHGATAPNMAEAGIKAPWPVIDRYPIVIGQGLSLSYFASAMRVALTGYRYQLVDVLNELLQKDPHVYGVIWKRILGVAGARMDILPADLADDNPESEQNKIAKEIAARVKAQVMAIPYLRQHLAALAWAAYYAIVGAEIYWGTDSENGGVRVERLGLVHSRRLSYPDTGMWDLFIWDQGQVRGMEAYGTAPTNQIFGLRVADYPNKFIMHAPQLRGDYPTREGIGIQLGEWMILKRVGARGGAQYLERFGRPWSEATYSTSDTGKPRAAEKEDVVQAMSAIEALGDGSMSSYTHPDTVTMRLLTPDGGANSKLTFGDWIQICNSELSKPIVGNTLTTEVGSTGGNRALGQVHQQEELRILKYDAQALCETLREHLFKAIVTLNYGEEIARRYTPVAYLHVEEPDPMALMALAEKGAGSGIAVDGDKIAQEVGLPVVPIGSDPMKVRRMMPVRPGPPGDLPPPVPPPSPVAKPENDSEPESTGADSEEDNPDEEPLDEAAQ